MDIKTRIDELTEAEAKAALAWVLDLCGLSFPCKRCSIVRCPTKLDIVYDCEKFILDEALKEARK
jgi:hypothetical protein